MMDNLPKFDRKEIGQILRTIAKNEMLSEVAEMEKDPSHVWDMDSMPLVSASYVVWAEFCSLQRIVIAKEILARKEERPSDDEIEEAFSRATDLVMESAKRLLLTASQNLEDMLNDAAIRIKAKMN